MEFCICHVTLVPLIHVTLSHQMVKTRLLTYIISRLTTRHPLLVRHIFYLSKLRIMALTIRSHQRDNLLDRSQYKVFQKMRIHLHWSHKQVSTSLWTVLRCSIELVRLDSERDLTLASSAVKPDHSNYIRHRTNIGLDWTVLHHLFLSVRVLQLHIGLTTRRIYRYQISNPSIVISRWWSKVN